MMTSLALPERKVFMVDFAPRVTLPDFITRASLELTCNIELVYEPDRNAPAATHIVGTFLGLVGGHRYAEVPEDFGSVSK
jgi:hypothetical protein